MLCVKTMRDMTAKLQDGYKKKKKAMHVNSNDACKNLVKYLKTEKILVSINRVKQKQDLKNLKIFD